MELTKAIKERRSIRRYKSDPVPHEVIQEILENAVWAPSAQNFKNNPEVVEETLEFLQEMGGAPCLILAFLLKPTYSEGMIPSCVESVAAAMNNICLLAYEKGLGTCWVEEVVRERERIEARFAPDKGPLLGAVVLGYPDTDPRPIKRKEGRIEIR